MSEHTDETKRDVIPVRMRHYLYPITLASVALLAGYGIVSDTEAALWAGLGAALLGLAPAAAYTPNKE